MSADIRHNTTIGVVQLSGDLDNLAALYERPCDDFVPVRAGELVNLLRIRVAVRAWGEKRAAADLTGIAECSEEDCFGAELEEVRAANWLAMVADSLVRTP